MCRLWRPGAVIFLKWRYDDSGDERIEDPIMRWTKTILLFALLAMTIGCDQITKHVATQRLDGAADRSFLADTLRLEYAENSGAFLSLGENLPDFARKTLLTVGCGLMLVALLVLAVRWRATGLLTVAITLLISGGLSNLIDRIVRGRVIDFLNIGIGPIRTGIFNVADVAIVAGVLLAACALTRQGLAEVK
jgi:signal peptidase II